MFYDKFENVPKKQHKRKRVSSAKNTTKRSKKFSNSNDSITRTPLKNISNASENPNTAPKRKAEKADKRVHKRPKYDLPEGFELATSPRRNVEILVRDDDEKDSDYVPPPKVEAKTKRAKIKWSRRGLSEF
jgi:TPR repeat protein